jgi:hypothetical protein
MDVLSLITKISVNKIAGAKGPRSNKDIDLFSHPLPSGRDFRQMSLDQRKMFGNRNSTNKSWRKQAEARLQAKSGATDD